MLLSNSNLILKWRKMAVINVSCGFICVCWFWCVARSRGVCVIWCAALPRLRILPPRQLKPRRNWQNLAKFGKTRAIFGNPAPTSKSTETGGLAVFLRLNFCAIVARFLSPISSNSNLPRYCELCGGRAGQFTRACYFIDCPPPLALI